MTIKVINENNNITITPQDTNVIISTGGTNVANSTTNTTDIAINKTAIASTDAYLANVLPGIVDSLTTLENTVGDLEAGTTYTAGTNINIDDNNEISATSSGATQAQINAIELNTAKVGITATQSSDIATNNDKVGITATQASNITTNNAKVGITPEQATAISNNTLKVGITPEQATAISNNTSKVGITTEQATAISNNTLKVGITPEQATAISNNTLKVGITPEQASAITANSLKVSNVVHPLVQTAVPANAVFTDTIGATGDQIAEIAANNHKVGITPEQANAIVTNSAKVGITIAQANAIATNSAKVGITTAQSNDIIANNAKVGITTAQSNDIIANNTKVGITSSQISRLNNVGKNIPSLSNLQNDEAFMIVMGSMNATGDPQGNGKPGSAELSNDINIMKEGRYFFQPYSKGNNNVFSAGHNKVNVFSQIANEWKNRRAIDSTLPKLNIINCSYENNGFNITNYSLGSYSSDSRWDLFLRQDNGTQHFLIPEDTINTNNSLFYTAQKAIRSALIEFAKEGKRAFHVGTVWNGFEQEIDTNNYGLNSYPANIRFVRNMVDEALGLVDSDFYIWKPMSNSTDFTNTLSSFQDAVDDFVVSENNVFLVNPEDFSNYNSTDSHLGLFNSYSADTSIDKKYYNETSLNAGANQVIDNFVTSGTGTETITRATAVCLDVKSLILSPKLLNGGNIYDHKLTREIKFDSYGTLDNVSFAFYDSDANTTSFNLVTTGNDLMLPNGTTTVLVNGVSTNIVSSSDQYSIVVTGDQTSNSNFATGFDVTATVETVVVDVLLNETDQTLI